MEQSPSREDNSHKLVEKSPSYGTLKPGVHNNPPPVVSTLSKINPIPTILITPYHA
jgi:hypothetical protein